MAKTTTPKRSAAPRPVVRGDVAPELTSAAIEAFTSEQAGAAADDVKANAIRDLLVGMSPADSVRILTDVLTQQKGLDKLARRAARGWKG